MPRLPTYQPGSVEAAPMPGVRQSSIASPDMFFNDGGAGQISKIAGQWVDIAAKQMERVDEARVQEKYTQLAKATNESVYGQGGVVSQQGSSAVGVADKWTVDFDKSAEQLGTDLTPRQQQLFAKYSQGLKRGMYDSVLRHESNQVRAYQDDSYKNLLTTAMYTAGASYRDGTLINMQVGIAEEAMRKRPEYLGASADVKANMEKNLRAGFHSAIVGRAIETGEVGYANEYFDSVKGEIPLGIRSKIEKELKPVTDFANGKALALEVEGKIASGEMSVTEGERYIIEKSKTKDAAGVAQSVMREMQDAARRDADKVTGTLVEQFEMRPSHGSMNKIVGSKEFRNMEPESRGKLLKYMRSELEQADDRGRARRNEQYRQPEVYGKFMDTLNDPAFASMSREEIMAKRPELGPELTTRLLAEHKGMTTTAARFQIDKDLLTEAIPKELLKTDNKDKLNAFKGIVESELAQWKANNPGKVPSLDEQKRIAQSANAEFVVVDKTFWFDGSSKAYEFKPMPSDFRAEASKRMREKGMPVTESALMELWSKQKGAR